MSHALTTQIDKLNRLSEVRKLMAYLAPSLGAIVTAFIKDGHVSPALLVAAALAVVIGVPAVFHPANPWVKGLLAFGTAALQALTLVVANATGWSDIGYNDWITVVGTAIGAVLAVYVPNDSRAIDTTQVDAGTTVVNVTTLPSETTGSQVGTDTSV